MRATALAATLPFSGIDCFPISGLFRIFHFAPKSFRLILRAQYLPSPFHPANKGFAVGDIPPDKELVELAFRVPYLDKQPGRWSPPCLLQGSYPLHITIP